MFKFSTSFSILLFFFNCLQGFPNSFVIQTYSVSNWNQTSAKNAINENCRFISNKCTGTCSITNKPCQVLYNFDEPVCGCSYCLYNTSTKQCNGVCSNTLLQTCVSKKANPKKSSDCICTSCSAYWKTIQTTTIVYNYPSDYYIGEQIPSCDAVTCYTGNSCSFFFVSKNRRSAINNTLYCACNNNNY